MEDDRTTITTEFQGFEISIVSQEPLLGTLELTSFTGANIEVPLDYYSAEALVWALLQFLAQGRMTDRPFADCIRRCSL